MAAFVNPGIDILAFMRLEGEELNVVLRVLEKAIDIHDKRKKAEIEALGITIANQMARIL